MTLKFKTKIDTRLGDSNDAMAILKTAVNNGQARLAMEVLVDVLDGIVDILNTITGDQGQDNVAQESVDETAPNVVIETSIPETVNAEGSEVATGTSEDSRNSSRKRSSTQKSDQNNVSGEEENI
jgi:hypothetical protein